VSAGTRPKKTWDCSIRQPFELLAALFDFTLGQRTNDAVVAEQEAGLHLDLQTEFFARAVEGAGEHPEADTAVFGRGDHRTSIAKGRTDDRARVWPGSPDGKGAGGLPYLYFSGIPACHYVSAVRANGKALDWTRFGNRPTYALTGGHVPKVQGTILATYRKPFSFGIDAQAEHGRFVEERRPQRLP
jgi:hypothetical protein